MARVRSSGNEKGYLYLNRTCWICESQASQMQGRPSNVPEPPSFMSLPCMPLTGVDDGKSHVSRPEDS